MTLGRSRLPVFFIMDTHYSREQFSLFMKYINPVALAADSGVHSQTIRAISKGIVVPKINPEL
jgi:hypothetical protein